MKSGLRVLVNLAELERYAGVLDLPPDDRRITQTSLYIRDITKDLSDDNKKKAMQCIVKIIRKNPYVRDLYLGKNTFSYQETQHLVEALKALKNKEPTLKKIELGNFGGIQGTIELIEAAPTLIMYLKGSIPEHELVDTQRLSFFSSNTASESTYLASTKDFQTINPIYNDEDDEDDLVLTETNPPKHIEITCSIPTLSPHSTSLLDISGAAEQATRGAFQLMRLIMIHRSQLIFDEKTIKYLSSLARAFYGESYYNDIEKKAYPRRHSEGQHLPNNKVTNTSEREVVSAPSSPGLGSIIKMHN